MDERDRLAASFVIAQIIFLPINIPCYIESVKTRLYAMIVCIII
jgi:hypothetical protein